MSLALTGCAGPAFDATKAKSTPIVQQLHDKFSLAGYKTSSLKGGGWSPDGGGNPNRYFVATLTSDKIQATEQCTAVDAYVRKTLTSVREAEPGQAIPTCIGDLLSDTQANGGFSWLGKFQGSPVSVVLGSDRNGLPGEIIAESVHYKVVIGTDFTEGVSGADGCPECLQPDPVELLPDKYLDAIQDYRAAHHFDYFTEKSAALSGEFGSKGKISLTPIKNADGQYTKLSVHWNVDGPLDRCYSLKPWKKQYWGIDDPGKPRPLMWMNKLSELNSFGQFITDSDCVN